MSSTTNYLITGANRGIGRGLAETYLGRPNSTVIAAVRDLSTSSSKSLESIPVGKGSKLIIVKIDSLSETDAHKAAESLSQHNVDKVDVVIANSGIANYFGPALKTPVKEMRDHFEVNTLGPVILFQAFHPLLAASKQPNIRKPLKIHRSPPLFCCQR